MKLVNIQNVNGVNVVSSRVVAEQLGKEHKHVLGKIKEISQNFDPSWIKESEYKDSMNRVKKEYLLTKDGFILLCMNYTGYNDFKAAYIREFNRMETELKAKLPATYKQALLALVEAEEEKERLALEVKVKDEIIEDLEVVLDEANDWASIKRIEMLTGEKYNWRVLKKESIRIEVAIKSVFDANYGSVKSYHKDAWMNSYSIDIRNI
jgi:Rha family phage regulatory protein